MEDKILIDVEINGNAEKTLSNLKQSSKDLRKELSTLKIGTSEYNATLKALQSTNKTIYEQNRLAKGSYSQVANAINATTSVISTLSSSYASLSGIMGISERDTEKVVQVMAKVQTAMSIAQTVEALGKSFQTLRVVFMALNTTMLANPFIALAAGIVAVGAALYAFLGNEKDTTKETVELNSSIANLNKTQLDYLETVYKDTNSGYDKVLEQREKVIESIGLQIADETDKLAKLTKGTKEYNEQLTLITKLETEQYKIRAKTQQEADEAFEADMKAAKEREDQIKKEQEAALKELEKKADIAAKEGEIYKEQADRIAEQQATLAQRLYDQAMEQDAKELEREQSVADNKAKIEAALTDYEIAQSKRKAEAKEKYDKEVADNAKKQAEYQKAYSKTVYDTSANFIKAGMGAIKENTVAYKALASANVIMDTAKGIMGITASMSQAGLAAPALIAAGVASVAAMGAVQLAAVNGAFESNTTPNTPTPNVATPTLQAQTPIQLDNTTIEQIVRNQRVYILESDIQESSVRVQTVDRATTF